MDEARIVPDLRVLDVGPSGEPSISIAALIGGSERGRHRSGGGFLAGCPRAAGARKLANAEFLQADVHQLPFADGTFDRVVSRLGVMFFSELQTALREMHRVLKPGGRTSHLAWGSIEQPYFQTTIGRVLKLLPELSLPASAQSLFRFAQPSALASALEEAGFKRVDAKMCKVAGTGRERLKNCGRIFRM